MAADKAKRSAWYKAYYAANRRALLEKSTQWAAANRERYLDRKRLYRAENQAAIKEREAVQQAAVVIGRRCGMPAQEVSVLIAEVEALRLKLRRAIHTRLKICEGA